MKLLAIRKQATNNISALKSDDHLSEKTVAIRSMLMLKSKSFECDKEQEKRMNLLMRKFKRMRGAMKRSYGQGGNSNTGRRTSVILSHLDGRSYQFGSEEDSTFGIHSKIGNLSVGNYTVPQGHNLIMKEAERGLVLANHHTTNVFGSPCVTNKRTNYSKEQMAAGKDLSNRSMVMSSPSTPIVPEIITPTGRARDSLVITPFHDDPYMIVRQAYTPIATDIKSDHFEDPIKTEETQPLLLRATPLSPDYYPTSPDYTPNTPHSDEESKPMEALETRTVSPSDSTSPLSPDHPLTQTSPTPTPS
ncbi:hypothetical protein Tco_1556083 [Tanacetum coccineum]